MNNVVSDTTVDIHNLGFVYPLAKGFALDGFSLKVNRGEIVGVLGPNGSGKTTLFRLLSTSLAPQRGDARMSGFDLRNKCRELRLKLGVVFQRPALDQKLTVIENLLIQGNLYGLSGPLLQHRVKEALARFGLEGRGNDRVGILSGGLARRVELAKSLLHEPEILIMDEPSTGLDPGARLELWRCLKELSRERKTTILLTTHLIDEAERCDRVGLIDGGRLVVLGAPGELKSAVGGDVLKIESDLAQELCGEIKKRFAGEPRVIDGDVYLERERAHEFIPALMGALGSMIRSVAFSRPTLEDVFMHYTGRRLTADQG
ncbi:MAG: ABC transporter ATP-binding protein [Elusimicrobia bacterium]|nr:ABC transporter ATP-binding protein [Elusimicrobiota bacterium]